MNKIKHVERIPIGSGKLIKLVITYISPQGIEYVVNRYVKEK